MNDIAADKYIHPRTYKSYLFWKSVTIRKIFSACSIAVLGIYTVVSVRLLVVLSNLCYHLITNFQTGKGLFELSAVLLTTVFLVYIMMLLTHIAIASWRLIYKDL